MEICVQDMHAWCEDEGTVMSAVPLSIQIKVFNGKSGFAVTDIIAISSAHFMKGQRDSLSSCTAAHS